MLKELKFVQGAVARKDFQPALTHFSIRDGRVTGYDGIIALSAPLPIDINAAPKAVPFVKAIERCNTETITFGLTPGNKIALRSGKFRAYIECTEEHEILSTVEPQGEPVHITSAFLDGIKALTPFIGTDASRPWCNGILLKGASAYATNNIVLAQYWVGENMPEVNIPFAAIQELNRIDEQPSQVLLGPNNVSFLFDSGRWMRSQILSTSWPDMEAILDTAFEETNMMPFPQELFEAVETLVPFVGQEGRIYFKDGYVSTMGVDQEAEIEAGAAYEIEGLPGHGAYHHKMLGLLRHGVERIDFDKHPEPCPFVGKNMRGVIQGMRDDA